MKIQCVNMRGPNISLVTIEAKLARGFAGISIVRACDESIRSGVSKCVSLIEDLGHKIQGRKALLNISPGADRVTGSHFDLAIFFSLLQLKFQKLNRTSHQSIVCLGEIDLHGNIYGVKNLISMAICAIKSQVKFLFCAIEAMGLLRALLQSIDEDICSTKIIGVDDIYDLMDFFELRKVKYKKNPGWIELKRESHKKTAPMEMLDFDGFYTKQHRKIALMVLVGKMNLLISGDPGCGKTSFCKKLSNFSLLKDASTNLDILAIHDLIEAFVDSSFPTSLHPFRDPHHCTSVSAMLGTPDHPGEISLAHGGFLFLDELPEFRRDVLEGIREPLENNSIKVSRARKKVLWPADFVLLATMNNCPCGYAGSPSGEKCSCAVQQISRYRGKISAPIKDRIHLHWNMEQNGNSRGSESKQQENFFKNLINAGEFSKSRNSKFEKESNSQLGFDELMSELGIAEEMFKNLVSESQIKFSNRSLIKSLQVARTLADLQCESLILERHVIESFEYHHSKVKRNRVDIAFGI